MARSLRARGLGVVAPIRYCDSPPSFPVWELHVVSTQMVKDRDLVALIGYGTLKSRLTGSNCLSLAVTFYS